MSHSGGYSKGQRTESSGPSGGHPVGRETETGLKECAWARLHRFPVGAGGKGRGNSVIGQAFLERVLWQWSGSQGLERHTGAAEGPQRR